MAFNFFKRNPKRKLEQRVELAKKLTDMTLQDETQELIKILTLKSVEHIIDSPALLPWTKIEFLRVFMLKMLADISRKVYAMNLEKLKDPVAAKKETEQMIEQIKNEVLLKDIKVDYEKLEKTMTGKGNLDFLKKIAPMMGGKKALGISVKIDAEKGTVEVEQLSEEEVDKSIKEIEEQERKQEDKEDSQGANKETTTQQSAPAPAKAADPELVKFNDLMKDIVEKNKGKRRLTALDEIEKLVDLIDSYKGEFKIMNDIKAKMNAKGGETREEKVQVVKNFVKEIV